MTDQASSQPEGGEWLTVTTSWGSYRVPADGFLASMYDPGSAERERLEQIERGSMDLSLGTFQDLLWMIIPESRPLIAERIREQLDEAIEYGRHLERDNNYGLAYAVYAELIHPALEDMPRRYDLVIRCLMVIHRSMVEGIEAYDRDPLVMEIMNRLEAGDQLAIVNELAPDLVALYRRIQSSR